MFCILRIYLVFDSISIYIKCTIQNVNHIILCACLVWIDYFNIHFLLKNVIILNIFVSSKIGHSEGKFKKIYIFYFYKISSILFLIFTIHCIKYRAAYIHLFD